MTTEQFEFILKNQELWKKMYKIQEEDKNREFQRKCREYQEILRRKRGAQLRFPKNT